MLLLAMFALVARYPDTEDSGQSNYDSSVDDSSYMEDVQILLSRPNYLTFSMLLIFLH